MPASLRGSEQSGNWDCFSYLTIQDHGRDGGGLEMSQREHFSSTSHKENEHPVLPASKDSGML